MDAPQVPASVFVFVADHEIVAPDCKPGNLGGKFLFFRCQTVKMSLSLMSGCVVNTDWVVGIQVHKFVREVKQLCGWKINRESRQVKNKE